MKFYCDDTQAVLDEVNSSATGLSSDEATKRLEENGKNKLAEAKKVPLIVRFFKQMADPMTLILIAAAVISAVTAVIEMRSGGSGEGFTDVFIIMAVVIVNAVLGVFQESKAEKAIEALQEMSAATSRVLRDGMIKIVKSEDLVVGDVVLLEAGDAVPADGRILESASLKIEEAALTGESVPVNKVINILEMKDGKDIPLGDRKNMMYMGSTVVYGRGTAVITGTGMDTEMGKIANALAQAEEGQTPLQIKLAQLSKILSFLVIGICIFIFAFGVVREIIGGNETLNMGSVVLHTFMTAISLAVAAIPEGLATVVTVVLSIGVTNMSKRSAIIRKLTAVETLGCAQIICSDKTGTLTQNKMTVVEHYGDDEELTAIAMACCSDAQLDENNEATGEPTECALVNFAYKLGQSKKELNVNCKRVAEAPFDSMRKMMSTIHENDGNIVQYTKGAPDEILKRCTRYIKGGKILALDDAAREEILAANKGFAEQALRVLAASMRLYDAIPENTDPESLEQELVFIGLTGMIDPIRPEVVDAIKECKTAGIRAVMITGDHKDTAVAIAKQLGIITDASQAITGSQLDEISDEALEQEIEKYGVYARVQPEHKVRIVNAWRAKGYVTAMTGDGVNDAPSIKSADIGVGMGITGTDVTKNVADMVLADDNFATIVGAVSEGRRIYSNIRKAIQFLLGSNMSEVLGVFVATMGGFTLLEPIHLLWINLITDCFPALALGTEPAEDDVMLQKPRNPKEGVFAGGLGFDVVYQGVLVSVLTLIAYFIGNKVNHNCGMTMAFLTMSMAEIFHSLNMRSQRGSLFKMKTQNWLLYGAGILSLILTTLVIEIPVLASLFRFEQLDLGHYAIALGLAFVVIPVVELVKLVQRKIAKS